MDKPLSADVSTVTATLTTMMTMVRLTSSLVKVHSKGSKSAGNAGKPVSPRRVRPFLHIPMEAYAAYSYAMVILLTVGVVGLHTFLLSNREKCLSKFQKHPRPLPSLS